MKLHDSEEYTWGTLIATHTGWAYVTRGSGSIAIETDPEAPHVRELHRERTDAIYGPPVAHSVPQVFRLAPPEAFDDQPEVVMSLRVPSRGFWTFEYLSDGNVREYGDNPRELTEDDLGDVLGTAIAVASSGGVTGEVDQRAAIRWILVAMSRVASRPDWPRASIRRTIGEHRVDALRSGRYDLERDGRATREQTLGEAVAILVGDLDEGE